MRDEKDIYEYYYKIKKAYKLKLFIYIIIDRIN